MATGQQCKRRQMQRKKAEVRRKGLCFRFCGNKREDGLTTCRKCRKKYKLKRDKVKI